MNRDKFLLINIISGMGVRGLTMLLGLIFVPLVINYLTADKYGIWLTLSSILSWISYLDVGLVGGLRILLAESIASNDKNRSQSLISTTYFLLVLITVLCTVLFFLIFHLLDVDFTKMLSLGNVENGEIDFIIKVAFIGVMLRFLLQPITTIYLAEQKNYVVSSMLLVENLLNLGGIAVLERYMSNSLTMAVFIFVISPVIILCFSTTYYFQFKNRYLKPSIKSIDFSLMKNLLSLGSDIFVTSICLILLIQSNNIIILKLFNAKAVTNYNLVYKLFSTISAFFVLLASPFWSAFADAYNKNEFVWIKTTFKKLQAMYIVFLIFFSMLYAFSDFIIFHWVGIEIDNEPLVLFTFIYFAIQTYMMIYAYLFNSMGIIRVQRNVAIFGAIVNIPTAILCVRILGMGMESILVGNIVAILPAILLYPMISRAKLSMV